MPRTRQREHNFSSWRGLECLGVDREHDIYESVGIILKSKYPSVFSARQVSRLHAGTVVRLGKKVDS